ncbi:hypothetical protein ERJ70_02430 [Sediminibacillus dalangtanensis]|uniref:Uncharacterized protein n=1 Tax=Sediminibacillus dalangtanensis TaxID=2729421 RepID=A0ABX7VN55_9BACI|nr:hypothetical protein [Sediminibacillus dalangtanensis]QTM98272.1 hypothetical protein ERJ70_02430 [Sediminibacillus dalangtanensis]
MLKRKTYAGILTILMTALYFGFQMPVFEEEGPLQNSIVFIPYITAGVLYGGFISIWIERITGEFGEARIYYAFIFHLGAAIPCVFYPFLLLYAVPVAAVFFVCDEFFRFRMNTS